MATINSVFDSLINKHTGLLNARFVKIVGNNLPTGDSDLYTVPSGKRILVQNGFRSYNNSAGNITAHLQLKVSSTYYRLAGDTTLSTAGAATLQVSSTGWAVFEAGDIISVNTTTNNGLNVTGGAFEFDDTSNIHVARILSLATGDNTLYTVTSGKSSVALSALAGDSSNIQIVNNSGGSKNYYLNIVNSGDSVSASNKFTASSAVADASETSIISNATLSSGDFLSINCSDGTGTQSAFYYYLEY